ncbi:MAG: ABC transporter permease [Anaerolineae bacterium]|nr:ABC transporter permease [Anaerolineae bacterium]
METLDLIVNIAASTLRLATPLILAAMAGLLSLQVGQVNIGLEGMMLAGSFAVVAFGFWLGSTWMGVLAAILVGVALAALFAFVVTRLKANLIVSGLALNLLASGGTAYLLEILFNTSGTFSPTALQSLPNLSLPVLSDLPLVGRLLFNHSPLVYVSWLAIPLTALFLYRTIPGIHIQAIGQNEEAARSVGIPVRRRQYLALMIGGALCGLAGAHLAVGDLALFREDMTAGRGFIALAAVYFAAGRPRLSALACLLFGLFEALQFRLQLASSIPPQFFQMLPYVMVVITLAVISARKEWRKGWS